MILDLDGVITRTATLHAKAWKVLFDGFLSQYPTPAGQPFDLQRDYNNHVDGKPRSEGVRDFLASRGIDLPEGTPDDDPDQQTICGLGHRKNLHFQKLLETEGVEVFDDAVRQIHRWRSAGLKVAVVSSSKNCRPILEKAGLIDLFETILDGQDRQDLGLAGKPAPDTFLKAAADLGIPSNRAAVFEDAISGVQAGSAGQFGVTVGVARTSEAIEALAKNGADMVVTQLDQYPDEPVRVINPEAFQRASGYPLRPPSAVEQASEVAARLSGKRIAVFLDYDGTLTPIVPRPEEAILAASMREVLQRLALLTPVAIVSGRDRRTIEEFVQLGELVYAGSHGFDIKGPGGMREQNAEGEECLEQLDAAEGQLTTELANIDGVQIERKRYAIAVHYRHVAEQEIASVEQLVDQIHATSDRLRKQAGKKVFELQPDVQWHKGYAVLWLLDSLGLDGPEVVPLYLGDDTTDEDAFRSLAGRKVPEGQDPGFGIFVGELERPTAAAYSLADVSEVETFLNNLADFISSE